MVYVRLAREWVDGTGASHSAGDMVDVDAATLAQLEESGVVTPVDEGEADAPGTDGFGVGPGREPEADGPRRVWAGPG
jgi:hypothetical protein